MSVTRVGEGDGSGGDAKGSEVGAAVDTRLYFSKELRSSVDVLDGGAIECLRVSLHFKLLCDFREIVESEEIECDEPALFSS